MDRDPVLSPEQFMAWLFQGSSHFDGDAGSPDSISPNSVQPEANPTPLNGFLPRNGTGINSASGGFNVRGSSSAADYNGLEPESIVFDALDLDSFEDEAIDQMADLLQDFSPLSGHRTFKLGEQFKVQDQFYNLIKQRLEAEIQLRPPLFPWETELSDYEPEAVSSMETASPSVWLTQLSHLNLPIPVPQHVLVQLLRQCQTLVQSPLREGAKLVQAVEALFPDELPILNDLAARVLVSPARSAIATPTREGLPANYQAANHQQQMVLSLLAAREIIRALNLPISQNQPVIEREWVTELGALSLRVEYDPQVEGRLGVRVHLPCGGSLKLQTVGAHAMTFRADPGFLSVEVFTFQPGQKTTLEIRLQDVGQEPLIFSIHPN